MQKVRHTLVRAVIFQDSDLWVAQCLEYDIGAQAPDLETLQSRLGLVIRAELLTSLEMGNEPFGGINAAPKRFFDMWEGRLPSNRG